MQACFWSELNRASGKAKTTSFLMLSLLLLLRPWKAFFHISLHRLQLIVSIENIFCDFCSFLLLECSFFACVIILIWYYSKLLLKIQRDYYYIFNMIFYYLCFFFFPFTITFPKILWMFEPLLLCYILLPMTKKYRTYLFLVLFVLFCSPANPTFFFSSTLRYLPCYPVVAATL